MKSPIKIILIVLAVLQLIVVTYIAVAAIPKKIENRPPGGSYISEELFISFDLTSDTYKMDPNIETPNEGRDMLILNAPDSSEEIIITRVTDEKYIEILNEKFKTLQNPFKARFAINTIKKDVKGRLLSGAIEERDYQDMRIDVYKGEDRRFIFTQIMFEDDFVNYAAEGNVGNYYYSIELVEGSSLEDILRFMETATVIQN